jgi:magnesium and cobalt transporter
MNMPQSNDNGKNDQNARSSSFAEKLRMIFRLRGKVSLKESVEEAIEGHDAVDGGMADSGERAMLRNVLTFAELNVEDVMIPRADINGIDHDVTYDELRKTVLDKGHTRFPIFNKSLDDVVGFVHIKDLLAIAYDDREFDIRKIIRQCLFVPPSMKTSALLIKMQLSHVHIAIVVDEYGGTDGIVTLEDLMEEIVGEIEDEHDVVDDIMFTPLAVNMFEASARIDVDELECKLGTKLCAEDDDDDFDTLGGLIFHLLGRVPALGEVASMRSLDGQYDVEFEISDSDMRRIKRVIIRRKPLVSELDESVL